MCCREWQSNLQQIADQRKWTYICQWFSIIWFLPASLKMLPYIGGFQLFHLVNIFSLTHSLPINSNQCCCYFILNVYTIHICHLKTQQLRVIAGVADLSSALDWYISWITIWQSVILHLCFRFIAIMNKKILLQKVIHHHVQVGRSAISKNMKLWRSGKIFYCTMCYHYNS